MYFIKENDSVRHLSMRNILVVFSVWLCMASTAEGQYCTNDSRFTEQPIFTEDQIYSQKNVPYGTAVNFQGSSETLLLDIYFPKFTEDDYTKRPLVLVIHGGSFISGSKADLTFECIEFAKRGFISASINYRLGQTNDCDADPYSTQKAIYRAAQDANAAMRYIVSRATDIRLDTSYIFAGGESAGAATALNLAYMSFSEAQEIIPEATAELGHLDTSGNSLTETFSIKGVFNNWGAASLLLMKPDELVPTISFHATGDPIVSFDSTYISSCAGALMSYGSNQIHNYLNDYGVCNQLNIRQSSQHGFYQDNAGSIFRVGKATCFFRTVLCDDCSSYSTTEAIPAQCSATSELFIGNIDKDIFRIFPNPVEKQLNVYASGIEQYSVSIVNMLGKELMHVDNIPQIDVSALSQGAYIINLSFGRDNHRQIFIKK